MTFHISLRQLAQIIEANLQAASTSDLNQRVAGISTDTRHLCPQQVFLALRGERFDGHDFVEQAVEQGVLGVIVDCASPADVAQLVVKDTLVAYQAIAHWWRQTLQTPLVAITGSVGKTTTKELIAAALSTDGPVLKTQANYNNEIGVPKTLLELNESHRYGVIEMGMRARGEITQLTQIAQPNIAVITNVGTAHIGRLGSEHAIAEAKCELLAELPAHGIAVLNHDNARLMATAKQVWTGSQITFGLEGGDVKGRLMDNTHVEVNGVALPLPLPGKHNAVNFLAAIAVMEALGLDWHPLQKGLSVDMPSGRSRRLTLSNDIMILDETYNAGLESMIAALQLLSDIPGKRHVAVLGTMKELGEHSVKLHQQVGEMVKTLKLDHLLTLADTDEAAALARGATPVPVEAFDNHGALLERLQTLLQPGDRVLFKASRAVALDQIVKQLK
ncbi:MAG: UDP-N-acetylmuramoyl-tripeptide--D-alanyl-D-alanine ligase [Cyanobacteria bacterium P01_F01_bin.86]